MTREVFVAKVREALSEAGFDPLKFAGHSFRIGAASTAASRGVEDSLIKTLGRWRSSAYLLYVRIPRERLAGLSTTLADRQSKVYFCILAIDLFMVVFVHDFVMFGWWKRVWQHVVFLAVTYIDRIMCGSPG